MHVRTLIQHSIHLHTPHNGNTGPFDSLDGIRSLSMCWVSARTIDSLLCMLEVLWKLSADSRSRPRGSIGTGGWCGRLPPLYLLAQ